MKTFFIVLVLCLGFLTTPINGVRPLTSSAPAPAPTCSPTTPSPASKKLGSATFGFYLLGFLVFGMFYSGYSVMQAGHDVEGEEVVVREEVLPRSPEAKLMHFVKSAGVALNDAKEELMKVMENLKKEREDVAAGAGGGEQQQDVAAGGAEIVEAQPAAVNSAEQLLMMGQIMEQYKNAANATLELEGALVLKLSIPAELAPPLKKIKRKKNKLDVHVETWTRRYEECRETDFLGTFGRPFSQGMKHAIPTLWAMLKPFAVMYVSVKMFWPAFARFNGVPEWEDVWDPI